MILEVNQMGHVFYIGILITTIPLLAGNDVIQPKSYNLEQFLNASERELRAHKKQLDTLEKQGTLQITPSQAQLFYPDPIANREQIEKNILLATNRKPLINPRWYSLNFARNLFTPKQMSTLNKVIAEDEKIHTEGGTALYHSTNPYAYGDSYIRTQAEELIRALQGEPEKPSQWLMLRNWRYNSASEKEKRKEYLSIGTEMDAYEDVAANLMSCSLGLPSTQEGESALYFWLQKRSAQNPFTPIIDISSQYSRELNETSWKLYDEVNKLGNAIDTGILLQAEVKDKHLLNKIAYPSKEWGVKTEYPIQESENVIKTPSKLIETMMHTPSKIQIKDPQARMILTGDLMLDPTNPKVRANVSFKAYANNQEALDTFHTNVDTYFAQ